MRNPDKRRGRDTGIPGVPACPDQGRDAIAFVEFRNVRAEGDDFAYNVVSWSHGQRAGVDNIKVVASAKKTVIQSDS